VHFYVREDLGPAWPVCDKDKGQWAGRIFRATDQDEYCPHCALIVPSPQPRRVGPAISQARIDQWNRRIARCNAYGLRLHLRDPIDYQRAAQANALKHVAMQIQALEVQGVRRRKIITPEPVASIEKVRPLAEAAPA
jgi:hypothetical protein